MASRRRDLLALTTHSKLLVRRVLFVCTVANGDDKARGDDAAALKGGTRNTTATAVNGRSGSRGLATSTAVGDETDQDRLLRHLNAREKVPRHTSVHHRGVHGRQSLTFLARVSCYCSCYSVRAQVIFLEGLLARLYATAGGLQVGTIYAVAVMTAGPLLASSVTRVIMPPLT